MRSRIAVIGNGSFAVGCLRALLRRPEADVGLVLCDPNAQAMRGLVSRFCRDAGLRVVEAAKVNSPAILDEIRAAAPDLLFSFYNMQILKPALLDIPSMGTVNFHNGPLPRYRGVHVYSWAIINGETEYGISWHWVDRGNRYGRRAGAEDVPDRSAGETLDADREGLPHRDRVAGGALARAARRPGRRETAGRVAGHLLPNARSAERRPDLVRVALRPARAIRARARLPAATRTPSCTRRSLAGRVSVFAQRCRSSRAR